MQCVAEPELEIVSMQSSTGSIPMLEWMFHLVFNKSGNQVKLQIYAISECKKRSSISFGLILVSHLINTLKAVKNSFQVAASLIQRKYFYSNMPWSHLYTILDSAL